MKHRRRYTRLASIVGILLVVISVCYRIQSERHKKQDLTLYEKVEALVERQATMAEVIETLGAPAPDKVSTEDDEIIWSYRAPRWSGYAAIDLEFDKKTERLKSYRMYAI